MTRDISCTALIDFSGVLAADSWHWSCRAPPHYPTIAENSVGTCEPTVTFLSLHSDFHCGVVRWRQCDTWSGWLLIAIRCQELIAELDQDEEGCITPQHHLVTITGHGDTLHTHKQHYTGSNRSFPTSLQAEEGGSVTNKQVHKWHNINSNIPIHVMLMTHSMFPSSPQDSPCLPRVIACVTYLAVLLNHWFLHYKIKNVAACC